MLFPTGDQQGLNVAFRQPVTLAAMEALFHTQAGAPLAIIGQPNPEHESLDNPLIVPQALSFLTYRRWRAQVKGLDAFPKEDWPDNIPLLYYSYHIMIGLGTLLILVMMSALLLLARRRLFHSRGMLWILMLALPFPYIATTAGWMTAELGRQPWLIYGVLRTSGGSSAYVSASTGIFTLLGFMGMYTVLGILFLFLVYREIDHGPEHAKHTGY
jgi:cytochrome bd ubiquinol oxidase subunit I